VNEYPNLLKTLPRSPASTLPSWSASSSLKASSVSSCNHANKLNGRMKAAQEKGNAKNMWFRKWRRRMGPLFLLHHRTASLTRQSCQNSKSFLHIQHLHKTKQAHEYKSASLKRTMTRRPISAIKSLTSHSDFLTPNEWRTVTKTALWRTQFGYTVIVAMAQQKSSLRRNISLVFWV